MTLTYYINLNFVCNEHCIFCASDRTNKVRIQGRRIPEVTLQDLQTFLQDKSKSAPAVVMIAGGEPTLHRELTALVGLLREYSQDISLFTNALRLSNIEFARSVLASGVNRIKISLFGAASAAHDAVTQVAGSFEQTLSALQVLSDLKREFDFEISIRLLASRQSVAENPGIVREIHQRGLQVDTFSLNRLIFSTNAAGAVSSIDWNTAAPFMNESMTLAMQLGYNVVFNSLPLCIFSDANAAYVAQEVGAWLSRPKEEHVMHYLDPMVASGYTSRPMDRDLPCTPDVCLGCAYKTVCGRVEQWYVDQFGTSGLQPVSDHMSRGITY